jgi:aspartate/methionine/tyrosine aminotransferase
MTFYENDYLKWYIPKLSPFSEAVNLHSSGVPPVRSAEVKPPEATGFEMLGLVEEALAKNAGVPKEELVFTSGATGGTLLVLLTLGHRRGRFVVETPVYEPMMRQARRLGEVRYLPRTFEKGWQIDLERADAVIDDETAVVLITEPGNPSGVFSSRDSVVQLAEICRARGVYLLINEVYLGYSSTRCT